MPFFHVVLGVRLGFFVSKNKIFKKCQTTYLPYNENFMVCIASNMQVLSMVFVQISPL